MAFVSLCCSKQWWIAVKRCTKRCRWASAYFMQGQIFAHPEFCEFLPFSLNSPNWITLKVFVRGWKIHFKKIAQLVEIYFNGRVLLSSHWLQFNSVGLWDSWPDVLETSHRLSLKNPKCASFYALPPCFALQRPPNHNY